MIILFSCLVIYMTRPTWNYPDTLTEKTNKTFQHVSIPTSNSTNHQRLDKNVVWIDLIKIIMTQMYKHKQSPLNAKDKYKQNKTSTVVST